MNHSVPTSKIKRGIIAGKTATMMAIKKITALTKDQTLQQQAVAKTLFQGLCQLRGTALKFAQLLSNEEDLLPEAYIRELRKAEYRVPPLNKALTYKILQQEFKKNPLEVFDEINLEAFAGASLGQVHLATRGLEKIAVKIQYPGISSTIKNDLMVMRKIISVLPNHQLLSRSLEELSERIYEETDYKREAAETEWFYKNFKNKNIHIPKVYLELSTQKVLSTSLVPGRHLESWLEHEPTQELRNKVCSTLFSFFQKSLFQYSKIHSDPHLGNFLFDKDGTVSVIDFGSVKHLPDPALKLYRELWISAQTKDYTKLAPLYIELGAKIEKGDEEEFLKICVIPYCEWLSFFLGQDCDFRKMSTHISLGKNILIKNIYEKSLKNFSTDFVLVHRTFYGMLKAFEKIDGKIKLDIVLS